jgi:iron complex outermembrane receptor protein
MKKTILASLLATLYLQPVWADDAASVFTLGEVNVSASPEDDAQPGVSVLTQSDLRRDDKQTVGAALNTLPGVSLSKVGARNEEMAYVRGFDLRQVPVFLDGVPVYVPYDGYVDLGRYNTFDLSRIDVAKGFSSMIYGPNTLGGAINLISRRPTKALEGEVGGGVTFDKDGNNGYDTYANVGMNRGSWYLQAGASYLNEDSFSLPDSFTPTPAENGGERNNSYHHDRRLNLKLGLTPNATDEYAIGYMDEHGVKGVPPYAGTVSGISARYWQWPYWDTTSLYLVTNTRIGSSNLKARVYHDTYNNSIFAYDDATYSTMKKKSSFESWYDDYTNGASLEGDFAPSASNALKAAWHYKEDVHREHNLGEPIRTDKDRIQSVGLEDTQVINPRLSVVAGVSYDWHDTLEAQDYNSTTKVVSDFARANSDATNGQIGVFYKTSDTGKARLTWARKSRFPTIKDRYSYKLGTALPNPYLQTEEANHLEVGYSEVVGGNWLLDMAVFHTDISNLIQAVTIPSSMCSSPPCSQMQNAGKARSQGVELSAQGSIGAWDLSAAYTYLDRSNLSNPSVLLTDTPKQHLTASAVWKAGRWSVTTTGEAATKRYSNSTGTQVASGFGVVNTKAGYRFANGVLAEAGVRNLFDRLYAYTEGFPEAGRTYFVQFNAPF